MHGELGHDLTQTFDRAELRRVLGHHPTGVAVVTATSRGGVPAGLAVGSFSSVSLDPPLVAFMPDRTSTSFPAIRDAGSFAVNVLSAHQQTVCRAFAASGGDKFKGLTWAPSPVTGSPLLDGIVAWFDCHVDQVVEAGDHFIVLGRVVDFSTAGADEPLVFFRGTYGAYDVRPQVPVLKDHHESGGGR